MKRIIPILLSLLLFIATAFAESGIVFDFENAADAGTSDTVEIAGLLKNISDTDMTGMTLMVSVENADPLITACGNDRITIRKRSDTHVLSELKPGDEIPVTLQWTVPDSINKNVFSLSIIDSNFTETARCTMSYGTADSPDTFSSAGIYVFVIRLITVTGAAALITWIIVISRKIIKKRGCK